MEVTREYLQMLLNDMSGDYLFLETEHPDEHRKYHIMITCPAGPVFRYTSSNKEELYSLLIRDILRMGVYSNKINMYDTPRAIKGD